MKIQRRLIDDLKTERADVTPSLPAYLRLVPILFYAVVLGGILLSGFFLFLLRNAAASQEQWKSDSAGSKQALTEVQARRNSIERQVRRAGDVVTWVEGARNLQPLIVALIRSMEPGSSISEFGLTRDPATPAQIKLKLKLNTQGARQLDTILGELSSRNFRTYNPNQTQARGEIDYEATLIYQAARAPAAPPLPSASR
jgi:hypothetical protein